MLARLVRPVAVLLLFVALPAFAEDPPSSTPPVAAPVQTATAQKSTAGMSRGGRVALEFVGGVAGMLGGGLIGAGIGLGVDVDESHGFPIATIVGMAIGVMAGAPVGTWSAGELAGGDGSLGWTFAGSLGGLVAGGLASGALDQLGAQGGGSVLGFGAWLGGGVLGYELSQRDEDRGGEPDVRHWRLPSPEELQVLGLVPLR